MAMAQKLIKALEPYDPMFIEEPIPAQNVDEMAELAKRRPFQSPPASGFSRSGDSRNSRKEAATLLQPMSLTAAVSLN